MITLSYESKTFGTLQVSDVMSAIFINVGTVVTGALDGSLLVWDLSGTKAGFGNCIQVGSAPVHGRHIRIHACLRLDPIWIYLINLHPHLS